MPEWYRWRGFAIVMLLAFCVGASLTYEVDTEGTGPEARPWSRVVPFFVNSSTPIELWDARYSVYRERWSLFGLVYVKRVSVRWRLDGRWLVSGRGS